MGSNGNPDYNTFTNWPTETELENIKDFDDVLELVGSYGKYQKRLLYCIVLPFAIYYPILLFNFVFLYAVPAHTCQVSENEEIGMLSLAQWRNLTIPWEIGSDGTKKLSECFMFASLQNHTRIPCTNGWDYDSSDYSATMSSTFNWVCDKATYPTEAITVASVGGVFGSVLTGLIGDKFGRKPLFLGCCFVAGLSKTLQLFLPGHFILFLAVTFVSTAVSGMILYILLSIVAEITAPGVRSWIYGIQFVFCVLGMCLLSLIAWWTRNWFCLGLIGALPAFVPLICYKILPSSPRWLLTQNRPVEASLILEKVATVNGRRATFTSSPILELLTNLKMEEHGGRNQGLGKIFSQRNLALNTVMLAITFAMNYVIYYGATINATNMTGNQFLDFFVLAFVELPAAWLGVILTPRLGRRWPNTFSYCACFIAFGIAGICSQIQYTSPILPLIFFAKFSTAFGYMIFNLQAFEIFPTPLRTTGLGFAIMLGNVAAIVSPSIVFLGTVHPSILYWAFSFCGLVGMVAASFLPETLNQSLPDTIEDGNALGQRAKYWSFLPPNYKTT